MIRPTRPLVWLSLLFVVAACSRKREPAVPASQPSEPAATQPVTPSNDDAERRAREAEDARRREEADRLRRVLEEKVYFDYDRFDLRDDARRTLDAKVTALNSRADLRLRIEGHADERGSVEYNLALSLRRAHRVRDYLTGFGISGDRFEVAGYGEERPQAMGSDEQAWAQNRRAEFVILGNLISASR